ncbi:adhesion G-protein coupled receptor G2 isoform X2 [Danio aesculapii]|uniref:adhesion G-protein coupled receptor G2 isoform X2 n=1 Tax=Danio aesculapii TaxID=1142201 RepID=UPI0024C01BB5|nr:adhesion G-protein coupled receptor G2 isoform X2 [Danio aesculapii]
MFWSVSTDHVKNHSMKLSTRGMRVKPFNRWSFWIRLLFLVLVFCPGITAQTGLPTPQPPSPPSILTTVAAIMNRSSVVSAATSPATTLTKKPLTETTSTPPNTSTTKPETTLTTLQHSLNTGTTPYSSSGITTSPETSTVSRFTGIPTSHETTTTSRFTGITTSPETTTTSRFTMFTEATTISNVTKNPTSSETTTISTSTVNTTSPETSTVSTFTKNTTFPETTTNFTTFTASPNISSTVNTTTYFTEFTATPNMSSTVYTTTNGTELTATPNISSTVNTSTNFTAFTAMPNISSTVHTTDTTTAKQTSSTPVTAPKPCDFSQSCLKAFYWMTTSVDVTDISQSQLNISNKVEDFFKTNLDACAVSTTENVSAKFSSLISNNTSPVTVYPGLFEALEITCDSNIMNNSQCYILLKLTAPANVCCIRDTVMMMNSADIKISVEGQIERVGVCADDLTQILAGQYDKCVQTLNIDVCTAQPQNISCGNSTNVIFPVGVQENCTVIPATPECYCSSHCNNSDFYYYSFSLGHSTSSENSGCQSVSQLFNNSTCSGMSSACYSLTTLRNHIRGLRAENSSGRLGDCQVIIKLDTAMDLCVIGVAVETIIKSQKTFTFDGVLQKTAICYDPSFDPLNLYPRWQQSLSTNFSSELVCTDSNQPNLFANFCVGTYSTLIPLNGSCNSSITEYQNFTTAPPSFTITINTNTSSINTTVTASVNQTVSTATVSTSSSGTLGADGLLSLSGNASSLSAGQVDQLLSQLESLLAGPTVSLALANTSVNIVNNLLDVPAAVITPFSKRAIGIVDTVGLKLAVSGSSQTVLSQSLSLGVKKVDGANFQQTSFSLIDSANLQIGGGVSKRSAESELQVRSIPLGSVVLPSSLTQNLTAEQQQLVSRVQFNFFQKTTFFQDKNLGEGKLNSGILGSSVGNLSISGLQNEVLITLRNNGPIPANYSAFCVFWDFGLNDGSGGWNPSGCRVVNITDEETKCACNHLTSFGILLDISKTAIPPLDLLILTYITYIGCGISAIFLSVTLLTYLAFGKLRKDIPSKILIHLCFALLLLNLVFLLDAWLALYPDAVGLCISTAFFLHYFLLASFTWMALEAVHMYLAIVQVFNTYISRFMLKIGFAGWGIPLIIVIIVIAVNKDNYGLVAYGRYADGATDDFCWIKNDMVFYFGVVAYYCLVFLLNLAMFIVVMIQLCRIKQQNPHNTQQRSGWQEMRSVAGLTVLLGLTWGFAFFAWGPVNLAFMYLFAIFNTLQGFFIFVFHCAMKENVRRQWRTYLCCGKLRLAENSEWSRTATQKINKASKRKMSSLRSSNSNHSSSSFLNRDSLASEMPFGIGNPMDDRIITETEDPSSNSDVILNELNNQNHRGQRSYR